MSGCLKIEEKMKLLLPLYGLLLCGLVQCSVGQTVAASTTKSPPDLVAPIEEDEEEIADELVAEVAKYGVVLNGVDLCGNIATKTFLPFVGNKHYYINCKNQKISSVGNCNIASIREEHCEGITDCSIVFDYKLQICTTNDTVDKMTFMKECEPKVLSSFCYDRTCTKYVLCFYNTPVLRECQDGLQYNSKTDRCDFPEFVDCVENKCSQEETPYNITYVASKASCEKYFICANGQANEQECSSGLYFDDTCPCCKVKDQVDCTLQSAQQRNIKPFSRSPPQRADIICPPQGVHFYAHKRRRDAYYYCVQGNGITLDCTPGLLYDVKTRECREPKYIA